MMAAIEVQEEGVGRNSGGMWGRENIKVCTKRYVRLQIRREGVCMCTGWHACVVCIYYLSIAYPVSSCDVSSLLQEQGADVVIALTGCIVQCSLAKLQ